MSRMAVSQEEWRKRANVGRGGGSGDPYEGEQNKDQYQNGQ